MFKNICIIVAAGNGERFGGDVPKQYAEIKINGHFGAVLRHSVMAFLSHEMIDAVMVVYNPLHKGFYEKATEGLKLLKSVAGGETRQESVRNGLMAIESYEPHKVLIHDAARPMVSQYIISDVLNELDKYKCVLPVIPVEDTIKKCQGNKVISTIPRDNLFRAQTPQGFIYQDIFKLHKDASSDLSVTDDVYLFEKVGIVVATVPGSLHNMKITSKEDLRILESFF